MRKLHITKLFRYAAAFRASAVFGIMFIVILWAAIGAKYFDDIRDDLQVARRSDKSLAMVFDENVLRSIGELDKALLYLRRTIESQAPPVDYQKIVSTSDLLSDIIVQVAIIDANGIMRASNVGPQPSPPLDLSDREHFRVHLHEKKDRLFISKPVIGRASKKWSVQVTRAFKNQDHQFGGVVVASLNPAHFTQFYDKIDFDSLVSISLIGDDLVVRSAGGSESGYKLGENLAGSKIASYIKAGENTTFFDGSGSNERLVAIRKVADYPLWVSVSMNSKDIFSGSMSTFKTNVIAGIALTLITLIALELIFRTEARARQKTEQLGVTLEHMTQGIMVITPDETVPIINHRCCEILNLPGSFVKTPPPLKELMAEGENTGLAEIIGMDNSEAAVTDEVGIDEREMPDGSIVEVRSGKLPDGNMVKTFTDITKRRKAEMTVAKLASEDPLTGLPNRRVFRSVLDSVSHASLEDDDRPFAVMFLDLDRFKLINDTLGHAVGDRLLQKTADRLKEAAHGCQVLARLGGDEFAIVISSFDSRDELEGLARAVLRTIDHPFDLDGREVRTTISIGIAIGPHDGTNVDDLLMAADLALYDVKASARNGYKFYEPAMAKDLMSRRQLETDLRGAIERNELELYYQPIVDSQSGGLVAFEALARWKHPTQGMVSPALFIPVAEDTRLILPLGEWVLLNACRMAAQWPQELKIAVNLSPVQFTAPNLCDVVQNALAVSGLAPGRLELEITERIFIEKTDQTLATLRELKALGVRISMDDFGTGYSSLSYLRSFPFDKIKIDRSFILDLAKGTEHLVIVQAVISIANALGMSTTAEGVETLDQKEFLAALGCKELQGFLFSKPLPAAQAMACAKGLAVLAA